MTLAMDTPTVVTGITTGLNACTAITGLGVHAYAGRRSVPYNIPTGDAASIVVCNTLDGFELTYPGVIGTTGPSTDAPKTYHLSILMPLVDPPADQTALDASEVLLDAIIAAIKVYFGSTAGQMNAAPDGAATTTMVPTMRILRDHEGNAMDYRGQQFYGAYVELTAYEPDLYISP